VEFWSLPKFVLADLDMKYEQAEWKGFLIQLIEIHSTSQPTNLTSHL